MRMIDCEERAACGRTCGAAPCPLAAAWMRRIALAQRRRADLAPLDADLRDEFALTTVTNETVTAERYF